MALLLGLPRTLSKNPLLSDLIDVDLPFADPLMLRGIRAAAGQVQASFADLVGVRSEREPVAIRGELNFGPVQTEIAQSGLGDPGPGGLMLPGLPAAGEVHLRIPPAHQLRCGVQALFAVKRPGHIIPFAAPWLLALRLAFRLVAWFIHRRCETRGQPLAEEVIGDELHRGDQEQATIITRRVFVAPPVGAMRVFYRLRPASLAHGRSFS